jgi:hypothetical protein
MVLWGKTHDNGDGSAVCHVRLENLQKEVKLFMPFQPRDTASGRR